MTDPQKSHLAIYPTLATLACAILILRLALAIPTFSPATDEPSHIGAAVSMIEAHKLIAPGSHPPLARLVAAIPLWLDGARLPQCRGQTTIGTEDLGYALGTQVLYNSKTPFLTLLIHARLAMLLFPSIALLYVYLLGRWLAGPLPATVAVIFFSLDPTFLGHAFWIGNDVPGCAGYLAATYYGLRWLSTLSRTPQPKPRDLDPVGSSQLKPEKNSWKSATIFAIALGLALSTKFSCILTIPALALIAPFSTPTWPKLFRQLPAIALIAFTTLWATYFFNIGPLNDQAGINITANETSPDNAAAKEMRQKWEKIPAWIRNTPIPMPTFFLSFARLTLHNHFGHAAYLNGQVRSTGWWYYFPEVFALKTPLGFLAALIIAMIVFTIKPTSPSQNAHGAAVGNFQFASLLIPPAVVIAFSISSNLDIGVRYLLPAIPFLYLFTTIQLARPGLIWILIPLICFAAIETAAVHPDYMSYFNLAAGGPTHGDRYALDNNLDWNQDNLRLADWIHKNAHGRPYALRLAGRRNRPLITKLGLNPSSLEATPHGKLVFIDKNTCLIDGRLPWLSHYHPIAHIGYSIDVYDLTNVPPNPDEPDDVPIIDDPWQTTHH